MSYLDTPRLFFRGSFLADAPTNNNLLSALGTVGEPGAPLPGWTWNANGKGIFRLIRQRDLELNPKLTSNDVCRVVAAWDRAGQFLESPDDDPVIGAEVFDVDATRIFWERSFGAAKLADLDPQQRRLTKLIGLMLSIATPTSDATKPSVQIRGQCRPTHMRDFWMRGYSDLGQPTLPSDPNVGIFSASAVFKTTMKVDGWPSDDQLTPLVRQLAKASPNRLSVRLITTAFRSYQNPITLESIGQGVVLGVIGPGDDAEPTEFLAARRLINTGDLPWPFNMAHAELDTNRRRLVVDLGNALPWQLDSWTPTPFDSVDAVVLERSGGSDIVGQVVGTSQEADTAWWLRAGGIATWDLTEGQARALETGRLGLTVWQGDTRRIAMAEHPTGKYADIDIRTLRLDPGGSAVVDVHARRLGKPLAGETLMLGLHQQRQRDPDFTLGIETPNQEQLINAVPDDVIMDLPIRVTTDATGHAQFKVRIRPGTIDLPEARKAIDSQLYFLGDPAGWQTWGAFGSPMGANCALNVLVFNTHDPIAKPTWADVAPILQRYARLYPGMRGIQDIGDEATVQSFASLLIDRLSLPPDDPGHMPVTRDLSGYHRNLILTYLKSLPSPARPLVAEGAATKDTGATGGPPHVS